MNLLTMSLSASVLIVTILMVRQLFIEKLPKLTFIALWIVVLIRLLVPYSLPSHLCLYNMAHTTHYKKTENTDNFAMQLTTPLSFTKQQAESNTAKPLTIDFKTIGFILWVIGLCGMAFYYIIKYKRSMNYFSDSIDYTDPYIEDWKRSHKLKRMLHIRLCDTIHSPLTYRILSPVILFPMSFDFEDRQTLNFVLEHEYQHIKHFDQLFKYFMIVAACIHWFNPFVWLMFFISNRDIEARCDESVLQHLGIKQKKDYATTLLNLEINRYNDKRLYIHFSIEPLEERITYILKNKNFSKLTKLSSFMLVGIISIGLATTANTQLKKSDKPVTMGNQLLEFETGILLTEDQTTVLYEGTITEPFEKNFALNIEDGEFLCMSEVNHESESLPVIVTIDEAIDENSKYEDYWGRSCYGVGKSDTTYPYASASYLGLLHEDKPTRFKVQIGNDANKNINADIKIMQVKRNKSIDI